MGSSQSLFLAQRESLAFEATPRAAPHQATFLNECPSPQRSTAESQACVSRTSQLQGTLYALWELSYWCVLTPESLCLTLERERGITSMSALLWSHEPSSRYTIPVKHEKCQWRNVLGSIWPVLCKTVKIMRTRKDGETLDCGPEGMKELLWPNAVWYPGLDSGKKDISGKTGEIQ